MYWLGFSNCSGIGASRFALLLQKFWTAENAWNATESELKHSGIGLKLTEQFLEFRKHFSPISYAERLSKQNVSFIVLTDIFYPPLLKQIERPPFILYAKGDTSLLQQKENPSTGSGNIYVAVVGTRKITDYGRQVTQTFTEDLAAAGCVIVSGLAMGVDAVAHTASLSAKGKTIAVLGSGVDFCTPRENQHLYERILDNGGLIISEYPLGQIPTKGSFPSRNRIIAGMSHGVLVPEGAEDSGSLITAREALKEKRVVFAVPGPITSSVSRGPISLINNGATMVISAKEILQELGITSKESRIKKEIHVDTDDEKKIIDVLFDQSLAFDEIVRQTGMGSSQVGTLLSLMEMKGFVTSLEAGMFGIAR